MSARNTPHRQPERAIQAAGVKLLRSLGADVWVTGTTRARGDYQGTRMTPGLPDCIAFLRRLGEAKQHLLIWEAKAPKGRLRPEQAKFAACCFFAGVAHVTGDLDALMQWLIAHGYLRADQVSHEHLEG